jgi:hypothetical protein
MNYLASFHVPAVGAGIDNSFFVIEHCEEVRYA